MSSILPTLFAALALAVAPLATADVPPGTDLTRLNRASDRDAAYRDRLFHAYMPLDQVCDTLKIGRYSAFENPTGILFAEGDEAVVIVEGIEPGATARLIIHDFGPPKRRAARRAPQPPPERDDDTDDDARGEQDQREEGVYPLQEGENRIEVTSGGLAYLDYRHPDPQKASPVRVRISGGQVNGVFSRADDAETWKTLLATAPGAILDIVGDRCQLVFDLDNLRKHNPERGPEMLALYDRIIELEQKLLGWDQDGCHPGNHILGRVQWEGYMHADDLGAAFVSHALPGIVDPDRLRAGCWGVAHEMGHVNQTGPAVKWAGTTEVTNNIFSAWVNYTLSPENLRLEHERTGASDGEKIQGGRFDSYVNSALVKKQLWQFLAGPDFGGSVPGAHTGDHFVSVCPLWQLQLYNAVARGNADFYPSIFHAARAADEENAPHGELRVSFFKRACDAAKLDLTDFFISTGMLALMDRPVEDYVSHHVTITEEMIDEAVAYASRYPKPDTSVIYYVTANSVNIFRDKLPVEPSPGFAPRIWRGRAVIPASEWKNAVAFEVYAGDKLVRVCLRGLGQWDNASTTVFVPEGATCIKAVQWDGQRFPVTPEGQPLTAAK